MNPVIEPQRKTEFERAWSARFREFAHVHDDDAGIAGWTRTGLAARLRHFERHFDASRAQGLWLDAGCGAGTYSRHLRRLGADVVGLDYSLESLRKARRRDETDALYCAGDVTRLPLRDGAFDGVLCFGVTQALSGSEAAVRALTAAARANGEVWIDGLNVWCLPHLLEMLSRRLRGRREHLRYETPARVKRALRDAGWRVERYWLPILPARFARFQGWLERGWVVALLHRVPPLGALLSHSFVIRARRGSAKT
ncbi:MAG TPA: class I SAM-dependent methyltransferase [Opitutus sp.]|nr:class I SAM-dependent methyltransferase [Opitutus sp.]